jgi:hypothetical protein
MEPIALGMLITNVRIPTFKDSSMNAVDRVMAAYAKTHKLTDEQADIVRRELSLFIEQFLYERQPKGSQSQTGIIPDSNQSAC